MKHPIEQWDEDQARLATEDEIDPNIRFTKTMMKIKYSYGDEELSIVRKKNGSVEIKCSDHYEVADGASMVKCDMGHEHMVLETKKFGYFSQNLTRKQVQKLIDFLQHGEN